MGKSGIHLPAYASRLSILNNKNLGTPVAGCIRHVHRKPSRVLSRPARFYLSIVLWEDAPSSNSVHCMQDGYAFRGNLTSIRSTSFPCAATPPPGFLWSSAPPGSSAVALACNPYHRSVSNLLLCLMHSEPPIELGVAKKVIFIPTRTS